jgi:hypothetical protein
MGSHSVASQSIPVTGCQCIAIFARGKIRNLIKSKYQILDDILVPLIELLGVEGYKCG